MRILVTGSEGFLGQHLTQLLSETGHDVVRYDLALGHDILDAAQLRTSLQGCDACIHLAAVADLYIAEDNPQQAQEINVDGTRLVVEICDESDIRLLYASTCCVYGNNGLEISDEDSAVAPTEHYARTKLEGEKFVSNSENGHTIMRIATFYGPKMRESLATSIFLRSASDGEPILIHGTGKQTRCFTHVQDICSGIVCVMENENFQGIINISDDIEISVNQLAKISMQAAGRFVEIKHTPERDGQIFRSSIDNSLLGGLGWSPKWNLVDGLRQCAEVLPLRDAP
jgi:UDP-glucose 4-epimerase